MRSALLTPYRALALAVEEAQRNFRTFAHIAALAEPADVRHEAEHLARNELTRAAALRGARRRAYHAERPSDMPTPATLAELRVLSATWEPAAGAPDEAKQLEQAFEKYLSVAERARSMQLADDVHDLARLAAAETSDAMNVLSTGALDGNREQGIRVARENLLATSGLLVAAQQAARPAAAVVLNEALQRLRAARSALADPATLPASYRN